MSDPTPAPEDGVERFLQGDSGSYRGGPKCATCKLPNLPAIERAARAFNKARTEGEKMPWRTFVASHMRTAHGYAKDYRSLLHHMRTCLGEEVS